MAVRQIEQRTSLEPEEFIGLSSDTKPDASQARAGATFWELDTKTGFMFDGISTWYPV